MDAADFRLAWEATGDTVHRFDPQVLANFRLPEDTCTFLGVGGLPTEAAPCLSFGPGSLDWIPAEYSKAKRTHFAIGLDGSGNPVVLDERGIVLVLDPDRHFEATYMNCDVPTLAEALLRYRDIVGEAELMVGVDHFDGEVPKALRDRFADFLQISDPRALVSNSPWRDVV